MKLGLVLAACLSSKALFAQTLEVIPARAMVDQTVSIRAAGLQPNERVTIAAQLQDGAGADWASRADFVAGAQGAIDTANQAPVAGSYKKDVSAMGLVWSMMPASRGVNRYQPPHNLGVQTIEFRLMRGDTQLAAARLEQAAVAEGVTQVLLRDAGLRGTLFLPPGEGPHPGILVLGGSEGGLPARRAAWLASHGYAALALAYFRYEDLPKELAGIPLEYFGRALNWMMHRPEIVSDRIAVLGGSRGGELALQLASMFPGIKAVVAYVPANVRHPACCGVTSVPYAWTWAGQALAFVPVRAAGQPAILMRAAIDVERIHGPVLLISGEADRVWDSPSMADAVVARLKRAHFAYSVEHLRYPGAGHTAGRPEIVPAWHGEVKQPVSGRGMDLGGSVKGDAESSLDAIPKVLEFLRTAFDG